MRGPLYGRTEMSDIPSTKPYLIRALYDWCVDAGFTPYLSVVVDQRVKVPRAFVRDGQIVLNIAPHATREFVLDNEAMSCQARFGGAAQSLYVPLDAVQAIYARENGQGMAFEVSSAPALADVDELAPLDAGQEALASETASEEPTKPAPKGHLRIIK